MSNFLPKSAYDEPVLAAASLIIGFLAWGAHAVVPWRLPQASEAPRKAWALVAMPLLLAAVISTMLRLRSDPDAAIEQGLAQALGGSLLATIATLVVASLFAVDVIVALGNDRFGDKSWAAAGAIGVLALLLVSLAGERLRIGIGPGGIGPAFLAATAIRIAVTAAAGEALSSRRPAFAPWAGLLLPCYAFLLPPDLRTAVQDTGLIWTSVAGGGLFLSACFLPHRWQRVVILIATVLAGLFLARVAGLSDQLGRLPTSDLPTLLPL